MKESDFQKKVFVLFQTLSFKLTYIPAFPLHNLKLSRTVSRWYNSKHTLISLILFKFFYIYKALRKVTFLFGPIDMLGGLFVNMLNFGKGVGKLIYSDTYLWFDSFFNLLFQ